MLEDILNRVVVGPNGETLAYSPIRADPEEIIQHEVSLPASFASRCNPVYAVNDPGLFTGTDLDSINGSSAGRARALGLGMDPNQCQIRIEGKMYERIRGKFYEVIYPECAMPDAAYFAAVASANSTELLMAGVGPVGVKWFAGLIGWAARVGAFGAIDTNFNVRIVETGNVADPSSFEWVASSRDKFEALLACIAVQLRESGNFFGAQDISEALDRCIEVTGLGEAMRSANENPYALVALATSMVDPLSLSAIYFPIDNTAVGLVDGSYGTIKATEISGGIQRKLFRVGAVAGNADAFNTNCAVREAVDLGEALVLGKEALPYLSRSQNALADAAGFAYGNQGYYTSGRSDALPVGVVSYANSTVDEGVKVAAAAYGCIGHGQHVHAAGIDGIADASVVVAWRRDVARAGSCSVALLALHDYLKESGLDVRDATNYIAHDHGGYVGWVTTFNDEVRAWITGSDRRMANYIAAEHARDIEFIYRNGRNIARTDGWAVDLAEFIHSIPLLA